MSRAFWLETARLGFSRWAPEDTALARQLWGDPDVTRLFSSIPWTDAQVLERLASEIENDRVHGVQYWPVFEREGGRAIGCCGVRMFRPEESVYIFGFHLMPHAWGKGYATEAGRAVVAHALSLPEVKGIFAGHHPDNHASRAVLKKLGFQQTHVELYEPTGAMHPSYMLTR